MEHLSSEAAAWQMIAAAAVFLSAFALVMIEKIHKAAVALTGALVIVVLGIVDLHAVYQTYIAWKTFFLLAAMMLLTGIAGRTGMVQFAAIKALQLTKGEPSRFMVVLCILTAAASALLDNVTAVLLLVPLTFKMTRLLRISPLPFLISQMIAGNIGGAATLTGNTSNMMIGTAAGLDFNDFLLYMAPVSIFLLIVTISVLRMIYARRLVVSDASKIVLMSMNSADSITDRKLTMKVGAVFVFVFIGFVLHHFILVENAAVALVGAAALMLLGIKERIWKEVVHSVDWGTILLISGLFIIVGGLSKSGIIEYLSARMLEMAEGNLLFASMNILWVSGVLSAAVDNIPFVAAMIPLIREMSVQLHFVGSPQMNPLWWSLALGACLGGNGTLIGVSANAIAAGMASRQGSGLSYGHFLKAGVPIALLSLMISSVYIMLIYF